MKEAAREEAEREVAEREVGVKTAGQKRHRGQIGARMKHQIGEGGGASRAAGPRRHLCLFAIIILRTELLRAMAYKKAAAMETIRYALCVTAPIRRIAKATTEHCA